MSVRPLLLLRPLVLLLLLLLLILPTNALAILYLPSTPSGGVFPFRAVLPRVSVCRAQPPLAMPHKCGSSPPKLAMPRKRTANGWKENYRQRLAAMAGAATTAPPPTAG